jgi:uncharacterized protein (DUF2345 family)
VEAQHDKMELASSDTLTLRSETLNIDFASKKRIHIATEEGASITIENGNITFECPGTITYYRMNSTVAGPVKVDYGLPEFPDSRPHEEFFILTDAQTGEPLADYAYTIQYDDHSVPGRTDAQGQTQIVKTSGSKPLSAEAKPNTDQLWLLDAQYWEQAPDEFQIDFLRNPKPEDE